METQMETRIPVVKGAAALLRRFVSQWKRDHRGDMPLKRRRQADAGKTIGSAAIVRYASVKD
jgi:hypothetical protein